MSNTIKGVIHKILDPQTGSGAKGNWSKQDFILKTKDQYPKEICISVWGDKVIIPEPGTEATVHFNLESREYNARWYTDVRAWKIEFDGNKRGGASEYDPEFIDESANSEDLPF